jgi:DNA mismatch repair protein MutL
MEIAKPQRRPIRLLDPGCVERIAAGEVIERPASVVKELVENSLDAGARRIVIRLKRGGLEEISVEDDGFGIPSRELPLAIERHATSKIAGSGDLAAVQSFGFRGEALASIAAVSRLSLRSRWADEDVGARIDVAGGRLERKEPYPRHPGTSVSVRDLFFNVPARREFLRAESAEKRAVHQVVTAVALAHPRVGFRLESDRSATMDLPPALDLETRVHNVLGGSVGELLRRFEGTANGLRVEGLASLPNHTRGNRTGQYVFVNRRPVQDRGISAALSSAYRDVLPPGRFPVVVLFVEAPPSRVDANVHPAKAEVRFRDERALFSLVRHAIQEHLRLRHEAPEPGDAAGAMAEAEGPEERALRQLRETTHDVLQRGPTEGYDTGPRWSRRKDAPTLFDELELGEKRAGFRPQGAPVDPGVAAALSAAAEGAALFWQLHNTFILTQIRGALVIVDQHNSHERILYNQAKKALDGRSVPVQQLLFPTTLDLGSVELVTYEVHRGDLERVGFLTEPFGGNTIIVRGIPSGLRNWNDGALLRDVLADLADAGRSGADPREAVLASMSCHGAIRAGERLTLPEMQGLMDQLFATELPYSCPHGRPTLIRIGLPELERRFGRR